LDAAFSIALMSFGIYAGVRLWKIKPNAVPIAKKLNWNFCFSPSDSILFHQ